MPEKKDKAIRILTPIFRASFAHVFEPHSGFEGQEPAYSVQMLFPKGTDLSKMRDAAVECIKAKWGPEKSQWPKFKHPPFKNGDLKNLEDYKGMTVVEARSRMRPGIVDRKLREIIDPSEFYSGCWARATVTVFAYDKMGNKGIGFGLQNIQKVKDDAAFSGKRNASDDFDMLDELEGDGSDEAGLTESEADENDF